MSFRALVSVGGYDFPEPAKDGYSGNTSTLVDSARNTQGVMVGSVIRDDVAKVEMKWSYLTVKQWADMLKCFSIARGGKFINDVTFFCQDIGDWTTRQMYVSDRKADMFRRDPKTGDVLGYTNCSLSLVEV
jgi:hypothetical protein